MSGNTEPRTAAGGVALVLAAAALWGTTGTAQAFAPAGATPLTVGAARLAIGGTVLLLIARARRAFPPAGWWRAPALGVVIAALALYQVTFFAAVARAGVAAGTVVAIGSAPVIAGVITLVLGADRPGRAWAAATALAVPGAVLLAWSPGEGGHVDAWGVLLALGAGASYAAYVEGTKHLLGNGWRPDAAAGFGFFGAGVLLAPVLALGDATWITGSARGTLVALHLGLVATAFAYVLFTRGLTTVPGPTAVTLTLAEPLTAAFLGVLVLAERLSARETAGVLLVLVGLVVLAWDAKSRGTREPQRL